MCATNCNCPKCQKNALALQGLSDCNCENLNDRRGLRDFFSETWNSIKGGVTKEAKNTVTDIAADTVEKVTPAIKASCKEGAVIGIKEHLPLLIAIIGGYAILFFGAGLAAQAAIYKWKVKRG